MEANVKMDVTELVRETIAIEVAKALSRDPKVLVEAVVKTALEKKDGNWGKTVFQEAVDKMIRAAALSAMEEWIGANKAIIKEAVTKRLKRAPETFANEIAEQVVIGLAKNFYVTANLKVGE
jgi:hypothetical protein